jgi:hypothetical protein
MSGNIEQVVRRDFIRMVSTSDGPEELDLDLDLVDDYGLTSLNKVLFLTSVCENTGVALAHFTEHDLAEMRTLRNVTEALAKYSETAA